MAIIFQLPHGSAVKLTWGLTYLGFREDMFLVEFTTFEIFSPQKIVKNAKKKKKLSTVTEITQPPS